MKQKILINEILVIGKHEDMSVLMAENFNTKKAKLRDMGIGMYQTLHYANIENYVLIKWKSCDTQDWFVAYELAAMYPKLKFEMIAIEEDTEDIVRNSANIYIEKFNFEKGVYLSEEKIRGDTWVKQVDNVYKVYAVQRVEIETTLQAKNDIEAWEKAKAIFCEKNQEIIGVSMMND